MARAASEDRLDESRTRHIDILLGARVRRLREDQGLTQAQVCDVLGISSNQWSRHESGENRIPAARLWQFCHVVGADVAAVFQGLPHSVGPVAKVSGMAETGMAFHHATDGDGAETRSIAAAARKLPASSRRLLLAIVRAMGEDAKKPV